MRRIGALVLVASAVALCTLVSGADSGESRAAHALAMHGDVKYRAGFPHFGWVNSTAPKGGDFRLSAIGTFDNLNPFILTGVPAAGLDLTYDTLTVSSLDEPFTQYGLLAETIETPPDRSWVKFTLRKEARFQDGRPVLPEDVIFTLETLKTKGHPAMRSYYEAVTSAEKVGERTVKFTFSAGTNRELPLIVGQMAVLPKHYWSGREFDKTTLEPPVASGPYRVESVDPGKSITYARVKNYWGAKLPVNVGRFNFDRIRYDYYRDQTVSLEAFKAGAYDFRLETAAKSWATGYDFPAISQGLAVKELIPNRSPSGMQGFVFNTRRPVFQDRAVREALGYAFDFEWSNKNLFYSAYTRTKSYFANSELAAASLPGKDELALLQPYRGRIPEEVFTRAFEAPKTDGSGNIRENLRKATELLGRAGWKVTGGKLVDAKTGQPFAFEILLDDPIWERIALPYARNLERLGIQARVRTVDAAQYEKRLETFDFDMTVHVWGESLSPGNEQRSFWSSAKADVRGSQNLAGIRDPAVDALVDLVIAAPDRQSLVTRTRALDRLLLWGHYVVPHWHIANHRIAYWKRIGHPKTSPPYGLPVPETWWVNASTGAARPRGKALVR